MRKKFEGVVLTADTIKYKRDGGPVAGARATVETDGEVVRRFTASRLLLMGPLALAFKKKKDKRGLYLLVEGDGFAFAAECDPKNGTKARKFAALINQQGSRAASSANIRSDQGTESPSTSAVPPPPGASSPTPPPPETPAGWLSDPTNRHGHRYWDGGRWTEHVSDGGDQSSDPV